MLKRFYEFLGVFMLTLGSSTPAAHAKIKNIIFDFGGVILGIDYQRTQTAFEELGGHRFGSFYSQQKQTDLFDRLETGRISSAAFRAQAKEALGIAAVSDQDFDAAWNQMLLRYDEEKLVFLSSLSQSYQTFLFSNTNQIHYDYFAALYTEQTGESFEHFNALFRQAYYSHSAGYRKPHATSFTRILQDHKLKAEETLFVDDSPQHLVGAKEAGLHTLLITRDSTIFAIPGFIETLKAQ